MREVRRIAPELWIGVGVSVPTISFAFAVHLTEIECRAFPSLVEN